jgi:uncharacterized protein (TIGR02391 family)
MVTRKSSAQSPQPANLTADQIRSAIPKLERRIKDLEGFDPQSLTQRNDPRLESLETKLTDTIAEIFGHGTIEYHRFAPNSLDQAGFNFSYPIPLPRVIESVQDSKQRELSNLHTIIELFQEKLADGGETSTSRAIRTFADLDIHPEIARACTKLFNNGHYAEAVEAACKVLDMLVKLRSMRSDLSGTELMQVSFSPKAPILKYNDQTNDSEKSEQQGMMFLFSGAMLAFRNPRAHGLVLDHPENAVDYISFLSMLAKSLDRTST